ncbi:hypothetical protein [Phyllobacterium myrsinacearum]|uniref:Uncharacterized protein n=1 Tax=Phyllobacterium myrsinacearum TaxID=28101 RepID=A0A2S9JC17_9HYPH|nr:hypothetical protein [Phyllobacterium myrsinacearum]PRD50261.1 hypothetical protein C5750_23410 [Phyllobacterium myrsinacearum]
MKHQTPNYLYDLEWHIRARAVQHKLSNLKNLEELSRAYRQNEIDTALSRAQLRLCEAVKAWRKYSPDQPRVPSGNPDGGQWTDGNIDGIEGGRLGARLDDAERFAFLPPYLIEIYDMGPSTLCTYQSWPDNNRFVHIVTRGEKCPSNYLPGYGPID